MRGDVWGWGLRYAGVFAGEAFVSGARRHDCEVRVVVVVVVVVREREVFMRASREGGGVGVC